MLIILYQVDYLIDHKFIFLKNIFLLLLELLFLKYPPCFYHISATMKKGYTVGIIIQSVILNFNKLQHIYYYC